MVQLCSELAVLHVALNPVTGPWSVTRELAKAQAASGLCAGVGIGLVTYGDWPKEYEVELELLGLPAFRALTPRMFGTASFLWQRIRRPPLGSWVQQLAASTGASSVVVHMHNAWLSGVFLPVACPPGVDVCTVATFHGVNADFIGQPIRHRLHRWVARRLLRHGARLTSVDSRNPYVAQRLLGIPSKCFTVIPNGVPAIPNSETRYSLSSSSIATPLVVGHVGTLNQVKGWRIAAKAVREARATGRDIRFIVAGTGPDEAEVVRWAQENPAWFEYAGFVRNPQRNILPRLDAFVLMAEREGLPMAIIEALSVGLPVIATPVGGIPDAVTHEQNGLLISRDVSALGHALCDLFDHRPNLQRMSQQARESFRQRFEITRIVKAYDQVYRAKLPS